MTILNLDIIKRAIFHTFSLLDHKNSFIAVRRKETLKKTWISTISTDLLNSRAFLPLALCFVRRKAWKFSKPCKNRARLSHCILTILKIIQSPNANQGLNTFANFESICSKNKT